MKLNLANFSLMAIILCTFTGCSFPTTKSMAKNVESEISKPSIGSIFWVPTMAILTVTIGPIADIMTLGGTLKSSDIRAAQSAVNSNGYSAGYYVNTPPLSLGMDPSMAQSTKKKMYDMHKLPNRNDDAPQFFESQLKECLSVCDYNENITSNTKWTTPQMVQGEREVCESHCNSSLEINKLKWADRELKKITR